ncbi:hypothetical protein B0H19DRAFT_1237592 [Mycena capillaripes]|nr:hypothetical protein B0H19DRAFT_1237592 [Mycena capillaripes]
MDGVAHLTFHDTSTESTPSPQHFITSCPSTNPTLRLPFKVFPQLKLTSDDTILPGSNITALYTPATAPADGTPLFLAFYTGLDIEFAPLPVNQTTVPANLAGQKSSTHIFQVFAYLRGGGVLWHPFEQNMYLSRLSQHYDARASADCFFDPEISAVRFYFESFPQRWFRTGKNWSLWLALKGIEQIPNLKKEFEIHDNLNEMGPKRKARETALSDETMNLCQGPKEIQTHRLFSSICVD